MLKRRQRGWSRSSVDFVPGPVEEEGDENSVSITMSSGLSEQQQQELCMQLDAAIAQVAPDADPLHLCIQCRNVAVHFIPST